MDNAIADIEFWTHPAHRHIPEARDMAIEALRRLNQLRMQRDRNQQECNEWDERPHNAVARVVEEEARPAEPAGTADDPIEIN